jgi:uncharacterized protein YbbC (DUF1343 family)
MARVQVGLENLLERHQELLKRAKVGLICHQASVDSKVFPILPLLVARKVNVTAIFAPEHGLWGTAQDQVPILTTRGEGGEGKGEQIPVYSLYGAQRSPSKDSLQNIDVMICDLQDVGSRYYTFIWTMALAMQACAKHGKKFVILDRPNPINGITMEGPVLDMNFASFVGLYPIPVRHGMTIGEIALWVNERHDIKADLDVIRMKGWRRRMFFEETGLPWVSPSPNMPTVDTAVVYPGACLVEGTNLSEGRGTTRPFETIGAPFLDGQKLANRLNGEGLPGVLFRACRFEPTFHKFQGQVCGGVQIHVTDRRRFKPFLTGLAVIQTARDLCGSSFAWRQPPYEYETEKWPLDILGGTDEFRMAIEAGRPVKTLQKEWDRQCAEFAMERKPFLLYD